MNNKKSKKICKKCGKEYYLIDRLDSGYCPQCKKVSDNYDIVMIGGPVEGFIVGNKK